MTCIHGVPIHALCSYCTEAIQEPVTIRYETYFMAQLRQLLINKYMLPDSTIDTFKLCLTYLELEGFTLIKQEKIS